MKKTFTDGQIVGILRGFEGSGLTIKEYSGKGKSTSKNFYTRRKRFGTVEIEKVYHFKQLQQGVCLTCDISPRTCFCMEGVTDAVIR